MFYKAGDTYYAEAVTKDPATGAAEDALATNAVVTKNGVDNVWAPTVTNIDTGRYKITGTIPADFITGDRIQVYLYADMGGVPTKQIIDNFEIGTDIAFAPSIAVIPVYETTPVVKPLYVAPMGIPLDGANLAWDSLKKIFDGSDIAPQPAITKLCNGIWQFTVPSADNMAGIARINILSVIPYYMAKGADRIYVCNSESNTVEMFTLAGVYIGRFGGLGAGDGQFNIPVGIAIDSVNTRLYVSDSNNQRIQIFDLAGNFINKFGSAGTGDGQFNHPYKIALDIPNNRMYVGDFDNHRIQVFDLAGNYISQFGGLGAGDGQFNCPYGIALDATNSKIYVCDQDNSRIQIFDLAGNFLNKFGVQGDNPGEFNFSTDDIAVDPDNGIIYISERGNSGAHNYISMFDLAGNFIDIAGGPGADEGQFDMPFSMIFDKPNGRLYVGDQNNQRIQVLTVDETGLSIVFDSKFGQYGAALPAEQRLIFVRVDIATGISVTVNPVQVATGVIQKKVTVTNGETIQVTRGDYLDAGDIAFNFGSDWDCTGKEVWFCVKKTQTGAKLIDVECTVTDAPNAVGQNPDIDLEVAGLTAGEYLYEYERILPDGSKPRTPKRGKFVVDQDIRN